MGVGIMRDYTLKRRDLNFLYTLGSAGRNKVGKSWFTFPGTKIFEFVLSKQLNPSLNREVRPD